MAEYSPINYSIDVKSPFESSIQGYQAGAAIRNDQNQQAQQQQQLQAQKQQQQILMNLAQKASAGTATAEDYASVSTAIPSLADPIKKTWEILNPAQQQAKFSQASQMVAAINAGRPDIAAAMADKQEMAARNSGNKMDADIAKSQAMLIRAHPESAAMTGNLFMAAVDPAKFAETLKAQGSEQRATAQAPADLLKAEAEAKIKGVEAINATTKAGLDNADTISKINERANRLGLDKDKLTSDIQLELKKLNFNQGQLPEDARKLVNEATTASVAADQYASKLIDTADQVDKAALSGMIGGSVNEFIKKITGNKDDISVLRGNVARIMNSSAIKEYKASGVTGAFSDIDVKTALAGIDPNAGAPAVSSYLRGVAKLQQLESATESAKAEWAASVGYLGPSKKDIEVNGIKVPAGSTYTDFAKQFIKKKVDERNSERQAEKSAQLIQSRGYMRFANPEGQ